jgi:hypothetical protein
MSWNKIAQLSALGACCSLAVWISTSSAKDEEGSVLIQKPAAASADGPVLPPPSKPADAVRPPQSQPPVLPQPPQQKQTSQQQQTAKPAARQPFMRPAQPREPAQGELTNQVETMPAPADAPPPPSAPLTTELDVRPTPSIKYDTDGDARRMYRRSGQIDLVMVTKNPADGCYYEIPLCIPACCTGDPVVSGGRGIFGRGVVEYRWSCGFRAIVKFRQVLGDVRVDYEGD